MTVNRREKKICIYCISIALVTKQNIYVYDTSKIEIFTFKQLKNIRTQFESLVKWEWNWNNHSGVLRLIILCSIWINQILPYWDFSCWSSGQRRMTSHVDDLVDVSDGSVARNYCFRLSIMHSHTYWNCTYEKHGKRIKNKYQLQSE